MMLLKSCLLLLALFNTSSAFLFGGIPSSPPLLVYATENSNFITFYKTNFAFTSPQEFLKINRNGRSVSNIFFDDDFNKRLMYWGYINSTIVGRFDFIKGGHEEAEFIDENMDSCLEQADLIQDDGKDSVFMGPGESDEIYFYSPKSRKINVYNFKTKVKQRSNRTSDTYVNLRFMTRNPCYNKWAYFIDCSENYTVIVFNLQYGEHLRQYNARLALCFDFLEFDIEGNKVYTVKGSKIYDSLSRLKPSKYFTSNKTIAKFGVGNNEMFYTSKNSRKLIKLSKSTVTNKLEERAHYVSQPITALHVYQGFPTMCETPLRF